MTKKYEKEYDSVTVSTEATDLTKITLTVPDGLDHNDVWKALRKFERSVLQERAKS